MGEPTDPAPALLGTPSLARWRGKCNDAIVAHGGVPLLLVQYSINRFQQGTPPPSITPYTSFEHSSWNAGQRVIEVMSGSEKAVSPYIATEEELQQWLATLPDDLYQRLIEKLNSGRPLCLMQRVKESEVEGNKKLVKRFIPLLDAKQNKQKEVHRVDFIEGCFAWGKFCSSPHVLGTQSRCPAKLIS